MGDYRGYIGIYSVEGVPKLGVPFIGGPIKRINNIWCLYWGPPILGNYKLSFSHLSNRFANNVHCFKDSQAAMMQPESGHGSL